MDQFLEQMRQNSNTLDDLDLAGSDDEAYSDNQEFIDSPIKDDYFEGKVEDTPILDEEDEGPDFTKMNSSFGSKQKKDIDLRKGITIEKNQNKPLDNIVQHSQSHFEGVQGMVL